MLIFLIRTIAISIAKGNLISFGVAHIQWAAVILLNCKILYKCVFVVSFLKKKSVEALHCCWFEGKLRSWKKEKLKNIISAKIFWHGLEGQNNFFNSKERFP